MNPLPEFPETLLDGLKQAARRAMPILSFDSDSEDQPESDSEMATMPTFPTFPASYDEVLSDLATTSSMIAAEEAIITEAGGTATTARSHRSEHALAIIRTLSGDASGEPLDGVRQTMLDAGVRKGTVSKILTVTKAVRDGKIRVEDFKSLSGGYRLAKLEPVTDVGPELPDAAPAPVVEVREVEIRVVEKKYESPEEMIEAFVKQFVKSKRDKKARYLESGRLIGLITDAITKAAPAPEEYGDESDDFDDLED